LAKLLRNSWPVLGGFFYPAAAFASGGNGHAAPKSWLLQLPGLSSIPFFADENHVHVNGALVCFLFILVISLLANRIIKKGLENYIVPSPKVTLFGIVDVIIEGVYNMISGVLGDSTRKFFPFIATIFLFVWFCNLMGLIPHGGAATASVNTTFALGISAFIYYNYHGIREHGLMGYLKHFLMGLGVAGVPIALLEIMSHAIRPLSLGIRLFVNMFVDHTVVLAFQDLVPWLLPIPLLLFGIVVSTIQAFVFATLTAVYVQMATAHEEH